MHVLISGAGIGGLASAVALQNAGYEVTVFEQHHELRITGAGINLWPNATRVIHEFGLKEEFYKVCAIADRYTCIASDGELIHTKNVRHWKRKYGGPAVALHRRDLAEMMAKRIGFENIKFGHKLIDFENNTTHVVCHFSNGEKIEGDFLIGADGIHSKIRTKMMGREIDYHTHPRRSYRWRGIVSLSEVTFDPKAETAVMEGDNMFGTLPIGHGKAYWYASGPELDSFESFMKCFGSWTKTHVPHTISVTPSETIMQTQLQMLTESPRQWVIGRVALIGDAAHPMFPDLAQGASQTFVDASVLGQCMKKATEETVPKYLKQYENYRRPTAEHVVESAKTFSNIRKDDSGWYIEVDPVGVRYELEVEGFKGN